MLQVAKTLLAGGLLCLTSGAIAQQIAVPASPVPPAPASAQNTPITVTPAEEGLAAKAQALSNMDAELAVAVKKLQIGTTSVQQQEVDRKLGAVRSGISNVPELVGVSGAASRLTAEFLVNGGIVRVAPNEWITPEWQVVALNGTQVTLARAGGKSRQVINFGHRPVSAAELARDMAELGRTQEGARPYAPTSMSVAPLPPGRP